MNKESFLKQLEYLLSDLPEEEKRDALDYYRDYLEDAGSEEARGAGVLRQPGADRLYDPLGLKRRAEGRRRIYGTGLYR